MSETYQRPKRLRRVQLATPGSNEKMMAKAAASAADHVFLDLEDAVAPIAKAEARHKIVNALNTLDWGKTYPGPVLPAAVVDNTRRKYLEAYALLTGKEFRE